MKTLNLFGNYYVKNHKALTESLFNPHGTANGIFKVYKNRVELTHTSGQVLAVVKAPDGIVLSSKSKETGRYMFSHSSLAAKVFAIPKSYMEQHEQAGALLDSLGI